MSRCQFENHFFHHTLSTQDTFPEAPGHYPAAFPALSSPLSRRFHFILPSRVRLICPSRFDFIGLIPTDWSLPVRYSGLAPSPFRLLTFPSPFPFVVVDLHFMPLLAGRYDSAMPLLLHRLTFHFFASCFQSGLIFVDFRFLLICHFIFLSFRRVFHDNCVFRCSLSSLVFTVFPAILLSFGLCLLWLVFHYFPALLSLFAIPTVPPLRAQRRRRCFRR